MACGWSSAVAQEVRGQDVLAATEKARRYLWAAQRTDGSWPDYRFDGGTTALAALALLNAGTKPDQPAMRSALAVVEGIPEEYTYVVALKIQALAAAGAAMNRKAIQRAVDWLAEAQLVNGRWGYRAKGKQWSGGGDFSNSQFALLGLHEAAKAGARVPATVWHRARRSWLGAQQDDGGWAYTARSSRTTGSMTTAGLASLYILGHSLAMHVADRQAEGQEPACCGQYRLFRPMDRGFAWLEQHFSVRENPGNRHWYYYYMYGLERVGILSGFSHFGPHDWYREGLAELLQRQRPDGSWREHNAVVDTAFALLFLAKGHRPILIQKLEWGTGRQWNIAYHDLDHLVTYLDDKLGEPVSWNTVHVDADLAAWRRAPILYVSGDEFPAFTDAQVEQLKAYIRQGGTVLFNACCEAATFREGFLRFVAEKFPDFPLTRLDAAHPIYRALFDVDARQMPLDGLAMGCRTSVLFCPRNLCCLWEYASGDLLSVQAFRVGGNIAAYATGLEPLPDKLDVARLIERTTTGPAGEQPVRGAMQLAQVQHTGDWRPNPRSLPRLVRYLRDQAGVDVVPEPALLELTDDRLRFHPILYMTGHHAFEVSDEQVEALRGHLQRGGFLLANACCGREGFDGSFRILARRLFPQDPLEPLPPDHPILRGRPGAPLKTIRYRRAVRTAEPDLHEPRLEGVTVRGRTVIVYSPYSLDCGLDGHRCFACRGVAPSDALRVAGNSVLYALSH